MSVTRDMVLALRHPRRAARRQLSGAVGEERAFGYLAMACGLIFLGQWPRMITSGQLTSDVPLEARIAATMLGWIFFAPLFFYALAGVLRLLGKLTGGQGTWLRSRIALFWSLLVASPLWLIYGLCVAILPEGLILAAVGLVALVMTVVIISGAIVEAERPGNVV